MTRLTRLRAQRTPRALIFYKHFIYKNQLKLINVCVGLGTLQIKSDMVTLMMQLDFL